MENDNENKKSIPFNNEDNPMEAAEECFSSESNINSV